jgi:hypothetical protein
MKTGAEMKRKYLLYLPLFIGLLAGRAIWPLIELPFTNPWGVTGRLTLAHYNPVNDIVRFIAFLACPLILFVVAYVLASDHIKPLLLSQNTRISNEEPINGWLYKNRHAAKGILVLLAVIISLNIPTYHASSKKVDAFHEGESLGTAVSYIAGKAPYKDFIFLHGVYQDPLRSVMAFQLFGRSIGAVRTLESIHKLAAFSLLAIFLTQIFRSQCVTAFYFLFVIAFLNVSHLLKLPNLIIIPPRDVTTFAFLCCIPVIQKHLNVQKETDKNLLLVFIVFSFIPVASFAYSIDRGFYLSATWLVLCLFIVFPLFSRQHHKRFIIASAIGVLIAISVLQFSLQGHFSAFFKYVFVIMPRYKEMIDGIQYPIGRAKFFAILVILATITYWVFLIAFREWLRSKRKIIPFMEAFATKHLVEFSLLLISLCFFRSALGRSDWEHVQYSSWSIYLLSMLIIKQAPSARNPKQNKKIDVVKRYFLTACTLIVMLVGGYRIIGRDLIQKNFPLHVPDEELIKDKYKSAIAFLRKDLSKDEDFLCMTNEAIWYYWVNKPCPIRFPVVWFAEPTFYQKEVVDDLKKKNIRLILLKNDNSICHIDDINNESRLPIIYDFIYNHYRFLKIIDGQEIWIKMDHQPIEPISSILNWNSYQQIQTD